MLNNQRVISTATHFFMGAHLIRDLRSLLLTAYNVVLWGNPAGTVHFSNSAGPGTQGATVRAVQLSCIGVRDFIATVELNTCEEGNYIPSGNKTNIIKDEDMKLQISANTLWL